MAIQTKIRRWGNSFGVVIPARALREKDLEEGTEVIVEIDKKSRLKEIFGSLRGWKIDAQKFKDDLRKEEWENDKLLS
jgi:antitoxin component of MazEF toxin-antitoxin module